MIALFNFQISLANRIIQLSMVLYLMYHANSGPVECTYQPNKEVQIANAFYELYTNPLLRDFSFNIVPCYRENTDSKVTRIIPEVRQSCHKLLQPSQICRFPEFSGVVDNNHDGKFTSTACPWSFKIDYNESRIPSQIAMAVCECAHCHRGRCVPVMSYIPVLMVGCNRETLLFEYTPSILEVPTGCTCARHQLASSRKNPTRRHHNRHRFVMEQ